MAGTSAGMAGTSAYSAASIFAVSNDCVNVQTREYQETCSLFLSEQCKSDWLATNDTDKRHVFSAYENLSYAFRAKMTPFRVTFESDLTSSAFLQQALPSSQQSTLASEEFWKLLPKSCSPHQDSDRHISETKQMPTSSSSLMRGRIKIAQSTTALRVALSLCEEAPMRAEVTSRCSLWAAIVGALPEFVIGGGLLFFVLFAIKPCRSYIRDKAPYLSERASLQWYARVVQFIILVNTFTEHKVAKEIQDSSKGWFCSMRFSISAYVAMQVYQMLGAPSNHLNDLYECLLFKEFTLGQLFVAIGLMGGSVALFPLVVDFLDSHYFGLRVSTRKERSHSYVAFLLIFVWTEQASRIVLHLAHAFQLDAEIACRWGNASCILFNLLTLAPSKVVIEPFILLTQCDSFDLLQLQILLHIPIFLATASLLQIIGEPKSQEPNSKEEDLPLVAMRPFSPHDWDGEPAPPEPVYTELKDSNA